VEELELRVVEAAAAVLGDEQLVGEGRLGVVVAPAEPRVDREGVEVPPVLLGVLAVVALGPGQTEDALLEDRVAAGPEGERQAEALLHVADAGQPVLVPAVGAGAGVVVGEGGPGVAAGAVVLADRAPGPLGEVGAPLVPLARLEQAALGPP